MAKRFKNTKQIDASEYIALAKELVDENAWPDEYPDEEVAVRVSHVTKMYKIYKRSWHRIINTFKKVNYKEFYALNDINVCMPKGDAIGILGTNGSGKSTLLKMVAGVAKVTEGDIKVNGRIAAMLELTSGFDRELTGYENIFLKATTLGIPEEEMAAKIEDIADFADIGDYLYQPVRTYSSGMKSRLGFAINVNVDPDILIVDEVLAVGDDTFKLKCLSKMEEFRRQGKTILFVSHNLFTVKGFCTKAMWIKDGELICKGDTATVTKIYEDYLKEVRRQKKIKAIEKAEDNKETSEDPDNMVFIKNDIVESKAFRFLNVHKSAKVRRNFAYGEPIAIEVEYEVKKPLENDLVACFSIRDTEDREIFSTDKQDLNNKIDKTVGTHVLRFKMENMKLLPGKYLVAGEMWNLETGLHFKFAKERQLNVTTKGMTVGGVMNIDYTIENDEMTFKQRLEMEAEKEAE